MIKASAKSYDRYYADFCMLSFQIFFAELHGP